MSIYSDLNKETYAGICSGPESVFQALIATTFTWAMTTLGAACVFLAKGVNKKVMNDMLGFAAGIMIAASFWSLLAPAIKMSLGNVTPGMVSGNCGVYCRGHGFVRHQ